LLDDSDCWLHVPEEQRQESESPGREEP
jgi:hypothetical protein